MLFSAARFITSAWNPAGLSRQEIAAATEALSRSIEKGTDSGGLAILERCAPNLLMHSGTRSLWAPERRLPLRACLLPECGARLLRVKENKPKEFIVPLITPEA